MTSPLAWDILHNESLSRGLIGHWKLDALTGASSNKAQDVGPNGIHGTAESFNNSTGAPAALPTVQTGKIRNSVDFAPGTTSLIRQRINLGTSATIQTGHLSVSCWVYFINDGTHNAHLYNSMVASSVNMSGEYTGFYMQYEPTTPYWRFWVDTALGGTANAALWSGTPATYNSWHHMVGTWDGVTAKLYVDGVLRAQDSAGDPGNIRYESGIETWIAGNANPGNPSGQAGLMRGRIDETTFWNRALDAGEVAYLYNAGSARHFNMLTAGWWEFNGTDAALRLPNADAPAFVPAKNTNDFTIAGCFELDDPATDQYQAIIGMHDSNAGNYRSWYLTTDYQDLKLAISKDGTTGGATVLTQSGVLEAEEENFFCGRYDYVGDGTSDLFLDHEGTEVSNLNSAGPVFSTPNNDVQIGDIDSTADFFVNGKIYWLAYWNRKLTDQEVDDLRTGVVHPRNLAPDFYWDAHQAVAATYVSEVPEDPRYWEFDVEGTPVKGGSSEPTLPVPIGEVATMEDVPLQMVSFFPEPQQQRASSQELGKAAIRDDVPIMITPMARPQVQRENAQELGIASLMRYNRKRGR